ncbi:MAG: hypothetical protein ACFCVK_15845 [Acidimicrobiales bacterium]
MGHDDCVDTVGDGIACEDENGTIPTSSDIGKPDLAPLHWLNTSVQSVSSSGHASFGQAAVSAAVSGCSAYRSASRSHRAGQPCGLLAESSADRADPTFSERVRDRGAYWGPEDLEVLGSEDLVERVDELASPVADQRVWCPERPSPQVTRHFGIRG